MKVYIKEQGTNLLLRGGYHQHLDEIYRGFEGYFFNAGEQTFRLPARLT